MKLKIKNQLKSWFFCAYF